MLNFLNKQIKKSGYKKGLSEKEFQSIFDHFLGKIKEEEKKKIIRDSFGRFHQMTRKKHFEKLNESLISAGFDAINESQYKDILRNTAFKMPDKNHMVWWGRGANRFADEHFLNAPQPPTFGFTRHRGHRSGCDFGDIKPEDSYEICSQLCELNVQFPVLRKALNLIKDIADSNSDDIAELGEGQMKINSGFFGGVIKDVYTLSFNSKEKSFMQNDNYIPYTGNEDYYMNEGYNFLPNIASLGEDREEAMRIITTHEIGHLIFSLKAKTDSKIPKTKAITEEEYSKTKLYKEWEQLWELCSNEDNFPSMYSRTNPQEFFAEVFAAYVHNKDIFLPVTVLEKMTEVIDWASKMS